MTHHHPRKALLEFELNKQVYQIYYNRDSILDDCRTILAEASNSTAIDKELDALLREMEVVSELTRRCIEENSRTIQNQAEFEERYTAYVSHYDTAKARVADLEQQRRTMEQTADDIGGFIFEITELQEPVQRFDAALWRATVDRILVKSDGSMVFRFYGGIEVAS